MAEVVKSQSDSKQKRGRNRGTKKEKEELIKQPTMWLAFKKSLQCKSEPSEVYDPKKSRGAGQLSSIVTKKSTGGGGGGRSGCSRSIANLKDVIHGSKRHLDDNKPPSCSPRSIGSSEFLNPITHEVILSGGGGNDSRCELKITGYGGANHESPFIGTLTPGTPGPAWQHGPAHNASFRGMIRLSTPPRSPNVPCEREENGLAACSLNHARHRVLHDAQRGGYGSGLSCHRCGEQFGKWEALESHHLSKHAVTELAEGDSSRKIVELICRTSWLKADNNSCRIERVLKVHNTQKTLARFEEHRETVKLRASKLPKKHPRCLADGNELLRFYGTTVSCSLGTGTSSSLCSSDKCNVCHVIRHGFSAKNETKAGVGVFTTSTSGRAFESVEINSHDDTTQRKALLVCRVIAGRVHKPLENLEEIAGQSGFDSLAGKVGLYANIEELYLLNPRALLPCFVVICKP